MNTIKRYGYIHQRLLPFAILWAAFSVVFLTPLFAQTGDVYLDMTLEELFDVEIITSASKKPEDRFEAPLSVTIIKREEILKAGITSIPEALRLAPGMIVREQTPGNYDIHIRGFDAATTNFMLPLPTNSIILVMIDNRIMYNYFAGGTFWETLPIAIHDINRIEVIRGPASALYGPNAAAGVINIITREFVKIGLTSHVGVELGIHDFKRSNASLTYRWNQKFGIGVSANYLYQDRHDEHYYMWQEKSYRPADSLTTLQLLGIDHKGHPVHSYAKVGVLPEYPATRSLDQFGATARLDWSFAEKSQLALAAGTQKSRALKSYYNNFSTPLSDYESESTFLDIQMNMNRLYAHLSMINGKHENNYHWLDYDFNNLDAAIEYDFMWNEISFLPALSYRRATYSGPLLSDQPRNAMMPLASGQDRIIDSYAFSSLVDYRPVPFLRFIGGFRVDQYNLLDELSLTYETAATWRINKNNLLRAVYSKANRAPFMLDSYIGKGITLLAYLEDYYGGIPAELRFFRNRNIDYLTNKTIELGWRFHFAESMDLDVEVFDAHLDDLIVLSSLGWGIDSTRYSFPVAFQDMAFTNTQLFMTRQNGLAMSFEAKPWEFVKVRLYGMVQKSFNDYDREDVRKAIEQDLLNQEIDYTAIQLDSLVEEHVASNPESTPLGFGGMVLQINPVQRLSISFTAYALSLQSFEGIDVNENYKVELDPFINFNCAIKYRPGDRFTFSLNGRNLFGPTREYAFTDTIDKRFLLGFSYQY